MSRGQIAFGRYWLHVLPIARRYIFRPFSGPASGTSVLTSFLPSEAEVVPATGQRAIRAATLRVDRNLAYADGFAMDLALDSADRVLVTADYGFKAVEDLAKIEFLPTK